MSHMFFHKSGSKCHFLVAETQLAGFLLTSLLKSHDMRYQLATSTNTKAPHLNKETSRAHWPCGARFVSAVQTIFFTGKVLSMWCCHTYLLNICTSPKGLSHLVFGSNPQSTATSAGCAQFRRATLVHEDPVTFQLETRSSVFSFPPVLWNEARIHCDPSPLTKLGMAHRHMAWDGSIQ